MINGKIGNKTGRFGQVVISEYNQRSPSQNHVDNTSSRAVVI